MNTVPLVQVNELADKVNKLADEVGMRFIVIKQSDWSELSTMIHVIDKPQ